MIIRYWNFERQPPGWTLQGEQLPFRESSILDEVERLRAELDEAKALLRYIEDQSRDVRCVNVPTGGGDADIEWVVIAHYMAEPREREIGYGWTVEDAIIGAMNHDAIEAAEAARAAGGGS
jgi:hypothetical protein